MEGCFSTTPLKVYPCKAKTGSNKKFKERTTKSNNKHTYEAKQNIKQIENLGTHRILVRVRLDQPANEQTIPQREHHKSTKSTRDSDR